jgi:hypothetical protein
VSSVVEALLAIVSILFTLLLTAVFFAVLYGIVVIVFRSAFGVELWNPFG